jgi:hypothetical protein
MKFPNYFQIEIYKNSVYVGRVTITYDDEESIVRQINSVMSIIHNDTLDLLKGSDVYQSAANLRGGMGRK